MLGLCNVLALIALSLEFQQGILVSSFQPRVFILKHLYSLTQTIACSYKGEGSGASFLNEGIVY